MAKTATAEPATAISVFEAPNALVILTDAKRFDSFYEDVKRETDKLEIDLTTEAGRKRIASMAYKVARTKTAIDEAGKTLTAEWREKISVVDEARRNIRARLDDLKDEVRAPLTKWEADEEARVDRVEAILNRWRGWITISLEDTPDTLMEKMEELADAIIAGDEFGAHFDIAANLRRSLTESLGSARERLIREAEDRAELERLRAAEVERLAAEEARRVEAEKAAQEAAAADKARLDAEHAAEERRLHEENLARLAAEAATLEAEKSARAEREAQDKAHADALAAERRRADEAEAARKAEAERTAKAAADAEAERVRLEKEQAIRDKDRKHRGEVMGAAKTAIMGYGVGSETARKIVLAIVAGEVPNVTLRF